MSTTPPQFATAEYKGSGETCQACKKALTGEYYRINGMLACSSCAEKVKQQTPKDSHAAFVRGLLFGFGGAIAGLIVYALFGIITGIMLGYVSLAVGWLVGKAIKAGSRGIGGRRYQIAAVALTYAAVSIAAVPIWISQIVKQEKSHAVAAQHADGSGTSSVASGDSTQDQTSSDPVKKTAQKPSLLGWLGTALLIGLASPFLKLQFGISGLIGLVILFIGLQIAWKMTAGTKVDVLGPFKAAEPAAGTP